MFERGSKSTDAGGPSGRSGSAARAASDGAVIQRKCTSCEDDERAPLQRKEAPGQQPSPAGASQAIVDDGSPLGPGQMHRSAFMSQVRTSVTGMCDAELSVVGRSAEGCPYIQHYLDSYDQQPAASLVRTIQRYAGAAPNADASTLMGALLGRVRSAVRGWVATGQVAGAPAGVDSGDPSATPPTEDAGPSGPGLFAKRERGGGASADPGAVRSSLGAGHDLDAGVRGRMESAFGQSFGDVRVHTGSSAAEWSSTLAARAFTVGTDVAFDRGEYQPSTIEGDLLIAHELAHVAQQRGGGVTAQKSGDQGLEQEADLAAAAALGLVGREMVSPPRRTGLSLQRCKKTNSYAKAKALRSIPRIGTQAFKRDAAGNIISKDVGSPTLVNHGGAPGVDFKVQPVQLQLQDGTWIDASRSLGESNDGSGTTPDHRLDADCHGVSLTDGQYWIDDDQMASVLKGGGFKATTTPKVGDLAVYRDSSGNVVHSVTVTRVDPATGAVLEVSGLGGLQMTEHSDKPGDAWHDPTAKVTYYSR